MDPTDGLQFLGGVEDRFDQQDVGRLGEVEPVGPRVDREEEATNCRVLFVVMEILLFTIQVTVQSNANTVVIKYYL